MLPTVGQCVFKHCRCLLQVAGEATLELTLSQFWSSLGSSSLEVELSFHGLAAQPAAGAAALLFVWVVTFAVGSVQK